MIIFDCIDCRPWSSHYYIYKDDKHFISSVHCLITMQAVYTSFNICLKNFSCSLFLSSSWCTDDICNCMWWSALLCKHAWCEDGTVSCDWSSVPTPSSVSIMLALVFASLQLTNVWTHTTAYDQQTVHKYTAPLVPLRKFFLSGAHQITIWHAPDKKNST